MCDFSGDSLSAESVPIVNSSSNNGRRQAIFWIFTIPRLKFDAPTSLPSGIKWIKGQLEIGETTGYEHWQFIVAFDRKQSLQQCRERFGPFNAEPTRSAAANDYVWKDDTAVADTRFEFGACPFRRNERRDWEGIWTAAQSGDLDRIPADVRVVSYRTLRAIASDFSVCVPLVRTALVFWGKTGTGKSRAAWELAGLDAYPKDPRSKFWDGYDDQEFVIVDEYRGAIDISHILRWTDRYPVRVEIKGSSKPLKAKTLIFTSNLHPNDWYPGLDAATLDALIRRLSIVEYKSL